ncbi:extracellular solute-binding protein [Poseidonocella sp. HB161398]|uniref:extracellular solute-binding protein n=1 Tax=Poseidonocella sp. HB161398 TaxID=2320855 RepID=UPI001108D640|nr:extracellular solute-binding protein [Poseidonocella sp. HB161398]
MTAHPTRRRFLQAGGATAAAAALMPRLALADDGTVNVYTGSDSNISDFWTNVILPGFRAQNGSVNVRVVDAGDSAGLRAIADRALAALGTGKDPQVELFEAFTPDQTAGGVEAGLWVDFAEAGIDGWDRVNPEAKQTDLDLPYRGSQVLLAYDATRIDPAEAPRSWEALTAWIAANPGQFIYNRPDKGGSGGNFVRRAIHEANGRDPKAFTIASYSEAFAAEALAPAWDILNAMAPDLYEGGAYTSGNTQSIQLLAQGVVSMTPVWSDQVLQAVSMGVLPETTGLVQLQDLALCGGFSRMMVPVNAAEKAAALELASYVLSAEVQSKIITGLGGFPGVSWDHVDPALREAYADVIPATIPTFPSGPWDAAVNDGWYRNVAPGISRG